LAQSLLLPTNSIHGFDIRASVAASPQEIEKVPSFIFTTVCPSFKDVDVWWKTAGDRDRWLALENGFVFGEAENHF